MNVHVGTHIPGVYVNTARVTIITHMYYYYNLVLLVSVICDTVIDNLLATTPTSSDPALNIVILVDYWLCMYLVYLEI